MTAYIGPTNWWLLSSPEATDACYYEAIARCCVVSSATRDGSRLICKANGVAWFVAPNWRWDWDESIRQYIIINLAEEELNRPIPPVEPPAPQAPPDWDSFETIVLKSEELNEFIGTVSAQNVLVGSAFPASFYEAKRGNYNTFQIVWNEIKKISIIDPILVASMVEIARSCNLPSEFIAIISN
jgi:hypothetical protein